MRLLSKYFLLLIPIVILAFTASLAYAEPTSIGETETIETASQVVNEVYDIMRENVYTRGSVDWPTLKKNVDSRIKGLSPNATKNQILSEFESSIFEILKTTNTQHSFYQSKKPPRFIMHRESKCHTNLISRNETPSEIGYLKVEPFNAASKEAQTNYISEIRNQIDTQVKHVKHGWIVDLRTNSGGNMWPMLAGIAPLLADDVHGYFVRPNGRKVQWGTYEGKSVLENRFVTGQAMTTENLHTMPIALLISGKTASSGEAVYLAFKGKPNVKSFGEPSCGMSTANRPFALSNDARLLVTVSVMADASGEKYGGKIDVDVETSTPISDAIQWLYSQKMNQ